MFFGFAGRAARRDDDVVAGLDLEAGVDKTLGAEPRVGRDEDGLPEEATVVGGRVEATFGVFAGADAEEALGLVVGDDAGDGALALGVRALLAVFGDPVGVEGLAEQAARFRARADAAGAGLQRAGSTCSWRAPCRRWWPRWASTRSGCWRRLLYPGR